MTTQRIAELREWANKLKEGGWDGDAENAREAVDEIERLQSLLWTPHEGDIAIWTGDGWEFHRHGEGQTR